MQAYINTDQQIHYLAQLITKANRTFLEARADDSHTNLFFDPLDNRLYGRWIEGQLGKVILTLNLTEQNFEWLNESHRVIAQVSIIGKTLLEVEKNIVNGLKAVGLEPNGFTDPLHFEIPRYSFTDQPLGGFDPTGLKQWIFFRSLANDAGAALLGHFQIAGEVRIWPHHFDTGIYAQISDNLGLGFGLAMADNVAGDPYFYLAGYSAQPFNFNGLPDIGDGTWTTEDSWKGAYFTIEHLSDKSPAAARVLLDQFILQSTTWYLENRN